MTWSESLYELTTDFEKNNRKREKEILEKINKNETKTRKKIVSSQWIESISIIKKQTSSRIIVERKNYVFIVRKRDIKSKSAEVYKIKNQWKHEHEQLWQRKCVRKSDVRTWDIDNIIHDKT